MCAKPQIVWAIVGTARGHVYHHMMSYSRRYLIDEQIKRWRSYGNPVMNGAGKTDAQFWRWLKKRNGWAVRRVALRVVR